MEAAYVLASYEKVGCSSIGEKLIQGKRQSCKISTNQHWKAKEWEGEAVPVVGWLFAQIGRMLACVLPDSHVLARVAFFSPFEYGSRKGKLCL